MNKQQALIAMMQGKYADIRDIETEYRIFGQGGDLRVRIEHYHDAVRALGSSTDDGLSRHSRLSAENIAQDVEMLRLITAKPFHMGRGDHHFSVSDAVGFVQDTPQDATRPDGQVKKRLAQHYKDYTVFFIALLVDKLEDNIEARVQENDVLLQDCHRLEQMMAGLAQGRGDIAAALHAADMVEHDGLRHHLMKLLGAGHPTQEEISSALGILQQARAHIHTEKQTLDKAGMRFSSAQLMVYEAAKDTVKTLLSQGINIAGKHTHSALQQTQGSKERGF